jgi:hypothetical protein
MMFNEDKQELTLINSKKALTFHHNDCGKVKEITIIGMATQEEIANLNRAKCGRCGDIIDIFISYLVKLRGDYFPKVVTNEVREDKDGITVVPVVSFRPPQPLKYRLCQKCFDLYKPIEFIKDSNGIADIEQLPDPINKIRDGLRFVAISPSMKASKYEADIIDKPYEHKGEVYEEQVIAFGCSIDDYKTQVAFRPSNSIPGETHIVIPPSIPKLFRYRPKAQTIRLHPSRHPKTLVIMEPKIDGIYPIELSKSKERRNAFKRWFERS